MNELINTLCNAHGLTRAQLAGQLKITRQTLHRWERADTLPAYAAQAINDWQDNQPLAAVAAALSVLPPSYHSPILRALARFIVRLAPHARTFSALELSAAIDKILS